MKKALILVCLAVLSASHAYADQPRKSKVTETICRMEDGSQKEGFNFEYKLKIPRAKGYKVRPRDITLCVPKGDVAIGMPIDKGGSPYKRPKSVNTAEDARVEAEMRADIIENVHR